MEGNLKSVLPSKSESLSQMIAAGLEKAIPTVTPSKARVGRFASSVGRSCHGQARFLMQESASKD